MDIERIQRSMEADGKDFAVMRDLLVDLLKLYIEGETREELAYALCQRAGSPARAVRWLDNAMPLIRLNLLRVRQMVVIETLETEIIKRGKDGNQE